eukprot:8367256-Pyramimonas_sp.AAC.1
MQNALIQAAGRSRGPSALWPGARPPIISSQRGEAHSRNWPRAFLLMVGADRGPAPVSHWSSQLASPAEGSAGGAGALP